MEKSYKTKKIKKQNLSIIILSTPLSSQGKRFTRQIEERLTDQILIVQMINYVKNLSLN